MIASTLQSLLIIMTLLREMYTHIPRFCRSHKPQHTLTSRDIQYSNHRPTGGLESPGVDIFRLPTCREVLMKQETRCLKVQIEWTKTSTHTTHTHTPPSLQAISTPTACKTTSHLCGNQHALATHVNWHAARFHNRVTTSQVPCTRDHS